MLYIVLYNLLYYYYISFCILALMIHYSGWYSQLEGTENDPLDPVIAKEMDKLLKEIWMTGNESLFSQIYHYILSENVSGTSFSCEWK